jgi:hypothetical protein
MRQSLRANPSDPRVIRRARKGTGGWDIGACPDLAILAGKMPTPVLEAMADLWDGRHRLTGGSSGGY